MKLFVKRQKEIIKVYSHLTHLFIHGVLHLLGYDHETKEQAKKCKI